MSITRPAVPDTRYDELRARARRANLIVSTREEPKRPEPKQHVVGPTGRVRVYAVDGVTRRANCAEPDLGLMPSWFDQTDLEVVLTW